MEHKVSWFDMANSNKNTEKAFDELLKLSNEENYKEAYLTNMDSALFFLDIVYKLGQYTDLPAIWFSPVNEAFVGNISIENNLHLHFFNKENLKDFTNSIENTGFKRVNEKN